MTALGTWDTGTPMSSARDTEEQPGFRAASDVMTDFLASVHWATRPLSFVAVTLTAPMDLATSSTTAMSLSTTSSVSPSHSTMHSAPQSGRGLPLALLTAWMLTLSMSSQDAGMSGLAMMAEMHLPASSTVSKAQRHDADFLGLVVSLSVTSVMIPSVPSDPHIRRAS